MDAQRVTIEQRTSAARRRVLLAIAAIAVVVAGLGISRLPDPTGDFLLSGMWFALAIATIVVVKRVGISSSFWLLAAASAALGAWSLTKALGVAQPTVRWVVAVVAIALVVAWSWASDRDSRIIEDRVKTALKDLEDGTPR